MRVFLLLLIPVFASAKTIELGFPGLEHRVKVVLPDGHDPAKKYPAILHYHGAGGKPDTSMITHHTGSQPWIVVGMTYFQLGNFSMTRDTMAKELTLLRSVKRHLQTKYGMDPARCYVSGFSKGGWMADMFLQADPSLAGGVILSAGHLHQYHKSPVKYRKKKPVFIGIGRLDDNFPYALKASVHHRKVGARITMDVWPDLGHAFPGDGSEALTQWLALLSVKKGDNVDVVKNQIAALIDDAKKMSALDQWVELRRIRTLPYVEVLGKSMKGELDVIIQALEGKDMIKSEAKAHSQHRKLLYREVTGKSLEDMVRVHTDYQALAKAFPGTKQSKLAMHDHERTAEQIKHYQEQEKTAKDKKKDTFNPAEPKLPENRRRIPVNPLNR